MSFLRGVCSKFSMKCFWNDLLKSNLFSSPRYRTLAVSWTFSFCVLAFSGTYRYEVCCETRNMNLLNKRLVKVKKVTVVPDSSHKARERKSTQPLQSFVYIFTGIVLAFQRYIRCILWRRRFSRQLLWFLGVCLYCMVQSTYHVDSILVKGVPLHVLRVAGQNFGLERPLQGALLEVFTWTDKRHREKSCKHNDRDSFMSSPTTSNNNEHLLYSQEALSIPLANFSMLTHSFSTVCTVRFCMLWDEQTVRRKLYERKVKVGDTGWDTGLYWDRESSIESMTSCTMWHSFHWQPLWLHAWDSSLSAAGLLYVSPPHPPHTSLL